MNNKYELTNEFKIYHGIKLFRIKALRDFGDVKTGDIGGWVESTDNLSQDGNCWICDEAMVYHQARIYENARVFDNAKVFNNAVIYGKSRIYNYANVSDKANIYDEAWVFGRARIFGEARIFGQAWVSDHGTVFGKAWIFGRARILGNVVVFGEAQVFGDVILSAKAWISCMARICNDNDYMIISPIGSEDGVLTAFKNVTGLIFLNMDCFNGSIDSFREAVMNTHKDNNYAKVYSLALEMIKLKLGS